jgi:hypothetical protein
LPQADQKTISHRSAIWLKLEKALVAVTITIQPTQLSLNVQAPYRQLAALVVTLNEQALGNPGKHSFSHHRPTEWALRLDGGGLSARQASGTDQCPEALIASQWQDHALDTGNQAQALTGETEAARHASDPQVIQPSAYTRASGSGAPSVSSTICG